MAAAASGELGQLDTIIAYCRRKLAKALAFATPQSDDNLPVILRVSNGRHAGCVTQIEEPRFSIGDDLDHDIMLTDSDISGPPILIIARHTCLGRVLTVNSRRDDVRLNKSRLVDGLGYERLPCILSIGSVQIGIEADKSVVKAAKPQHELMMILSLIAVGIFAWTVPSWLPVPHNTVLQTAATNVASESEIPMDAPLSQILEDRIASTNLSDYVSVQLGPDNTVTLSGSVPTGLMTPWRSLLSELDTTTYANRLLVKVKQASELGSLPAISIVQLSGDPMLVLSSGKLLGLGDEIVDEWTIDAITSSGLTLSRAGEAIEVTY